MPTTEEPLSLSDAQEQIVLATINGDWTRVGNTVYFGIDASWIAFPGDIERAEAIATLPALCCVLLREVEALRKEAEKREAEDADRY